MQQMVSLGAVLLGLISTFVGYNYLRLMKTTTLLEYTLLRRVLPVVCVIATMVIAIAAGNCVLACAKRRAGNDDAAGSCTYAENGDYHPRTALGQREGDQQVKCDSIESGNKNISHAVKAGRPDFSALVRRAAAKLDNGQRLVVAACGPVGYGPRSEKGFCFGEEGGRRARASRVFWSRVDLVAVIESERPTVCVNVYCV